MYKRVYENYTNTVLLRELEHPRIWVPQGVLELTPP